jgi:hypothetical protein
LIVEIADASRRSRIRILVAIEDDYRAYREAIAASIQVLRPHVQVATARLEALEAEVTRFEPHVVICSLPATASPGGHVAWVEISLEPTRPSIICIGGRYSKGHNPALDALLEVIDEAERLVGKES